MKRIAHVQVIPKLSGAQKFSLEIFKNVSNFEKYIICAEFEDETEEQRNDFVTHFKQANVNIIWCKNLKRKIGFHDIKSIIELYNIFRKYKFDVVHTNSTKPGIIARIAAKIAGVKKVIHTVHGISFHKEVNIFSRIIFYFLEIVALQFGNTNVTVNKNYLKYYKFMFWKKKDHSQTIEKIALELVANRQETGVLPFLSLKDAAKYAENKSPLISVGFVQCHVIINGGYYNLEFKPHPDKGVYMSAYLYEM